MDKKEINKRAPIFDLGPNACRAVITVTVMVALVVVIAIAIMVRESAFSVIINGEEKSVKLEFEDSEVNLAEILDRALAANDSEQNRKLTKAVLSSHGFVETRSSELVEAIRSLNEEDSEDIVRAIRLVLFNLEGPFKPPGTLHEAPDDRLLEAINDLYKHQAHHPLIAQLWKMSLEHDGLFSLQEFPANVAVDSELQDGRANACYNSVLEHKRIQIRSKESGVMEKFIVKANHPCTRIGVSEMLAKEKGVKLFISPGDFENLFGQQTVEGATDAFFFILPQYFVLSSS